jgi:nucleoid DNA-binding protein
MSNRIDKKELVRRVAVRTDVNVEVASKFVEATLEEIYTH